MLPAALQRQPCQHSCLAGAGGGAACCLIDIGGVPQVAQHPDAAILERGRLWVLVLVYHVLVETFGHELIGQGVHQGGYERGQVQARVAVEHKLIVNDGVGSLGIHLVIGQLVARDLAAP
jgi:hypothetical protein